MTGARQAIVAAPPAVLAAAVAVLAAAVAVLAAAAALPAQTTTAPADSDSVAAVTGMPQARYFVLRAHLPADAGAPQVAVARSRYVANFGSRDGVRTGSIFQVYWRALQVGMMRVEKVYRDSASLRLLRLDRKIDANVAAPVQPGYPLYPHYVLLESVNFGTGAPNFSPGMHERLRYAARFILNNPDFPVVLEGHTDDTGPRDVNVRLARERAEQVKTYLYDIQRIPRTRMHTVGYAADRPLATNATEEGRFLNRRVDVVMVNQLPREAIEQAGATAAPAAP